MPRIAAISDLHLGVPSSYLTLTDVKERLFAAIAKRAGGRLDALFLVGDVIDLAVGQFPDPWISAREFFADLACQEFQIDKVIYIPGNHDHHLWVQLVESQVLLPFLDASDGCEPPDLSSHRVFGYPTPLHDLFPKSLRKNVFFAYPHFSFCDKPAQTRFTFHHGHYLDPSITPLGVSVAEDYRDLAKIEMYNLAYMESMFYFFSWDSAVQATELAAYDAVSKAEGFYRKLREIVMPQERLERRGHLIRRGLQFVSRMRRRRLPAEQPQGIQSTCDSHMPSISRARRLDMLRDCINRNVSPAIAHDIWILGHTHRPAEWPKSEIEGTVKLYNLGGWVAPPRPEWDDPQTWPEPALFYWDRVTGPALEYVEISPKDRQRLLNRVRGLQEIVKRQ